MCSFPPGDWTASSSRFLAADLLYRLQQNFVGASSLAQTVPNLIVVLGTCRRMSLRGAGRLLMVAIRRFLGFRIVFFLPVCL